MTLKLELAAARLKQAEAEVVRHEKVAQSFRQQYEEAADIIADMGAKYQAFEQGIQQNMEASPQSCIRIVSLSCMCSPARQKKECTARCHNTDSAGAFCNVLACNHPYRKLAGAGNGLVGRSIKIDLRADLQANEGGVRQADAAQCSDGKAAEEARQRVCAPARGAGRSAGQGRAAGCREPEAEGAGTPFLPFHPARARILLRFYKQALQASSPSLG